MLNLSLIVYKYKQEMRKIIIRKYTYVPTVRLKAGLAAIEGKVVTVLAWSEK